MARVANTVLMCFNLITLGIGIAVLVLRPFGTCYILVYMPLVFLGALIVVLSLLGLLGLCCRSPLLMWLHLALYAGLILVVTFIMFLEIIVMTKEVARLEVRTAGDPHKLDAFSKALQNYFVGSSKWSRVRQCLIRHDFCLTRHRHRIYSKLQVSCCIAPLSCKQNNNNSTNGNTGEERENQDCKLWKNEREYMCYNCGTCKAGFLSLFTAMWFRVFPAVVTMLIILIFIFSLGCYSLKDIKAKHYERKHCNPTAKP